MHDIDMVVLDRSKSCRLDEDFHENRENRDLD